MSLSAVSSSSGSATGLGSDSTSKMTQLLKQLQTVQKQLAAEVQSSDDAKTKLQMEQALQLQLIEIQAQIQELQQQQAQKAQSAAATAAPGAPANSSPSDGSIRSPDRSWSVLSAQA